VNDQGGHLTGIGEEDAEADRTPSANEPDYSQTSVGMTDADLRNIMLSSMRLTIVFAVLAALAFAWRVNWQSAVLVVIGAVISTASLWEWLRLTTAMNAMMDAKPEGAAATKPLATGLIPITFLVRIALTLGILYVSLKFLHGTPFALAAGLGLGVLSLSIEAFRLLKYAPK
jgi:hypothetical protein